MKDEENIPLYYELNGRKERKKDDKEEKMTIIERKKKRNEIIKKTIDCKLRENIQP